MSSLTICFLFTGIFSLLNKKATRKTNSTVVDTTRNARLPDSFFLFHSQISYSSSSPELSDKGIYPYFYRTIPHDSSFNAPRIALLKSFNWKHVATIFQEENLFRTVRSCLTIEFCAVSHAYLNKRPQRKRASTHIKIGDLLLDLAGHFATFIYMHFFYFNGLSSDVPYAGSWHAELLGKALAYLCVVLVHFSGCVAFFSAFFHGLFVYKLPRSLFLLC